jgi:hypothetical protein
MSRTILTALALTSCLVAACGNDFDPSSTITGVRVLGVRVETPYAKPGTKPKLDMLVVDGSPARTTRKVQVVWFHGCKNPKGDIFYECYPELSQRLGAAFGGKPTAIDKDIPGLVSLGTSAVADVPADTISSRPPAMPGAPAQGRVFVFFAACSGRVTYDPSPPDSSGLPIRCVDAGGADLSADDFVYGYTPIFVFDQLVNAQPTVGAPTFNGAPVSNTTCKAGCPAGYACGPNDRCLPALGICNASKADDCGNFEFKPAIDPASAEVDPIASALDGKDTRESIYVQYAAINGRFSSEASAKIVNDPNVGWNDDYGGKFVTYHSQLGVATLYAVVRDNRGGQAPPQDSTRKRRRTKT